MEEISLKDLELRLQKQVENARRAVDKNPTYSVDILTNIVSRNPGCLEVRRILRHAQQRSTKGKSKGLGRMFGRLTSLPFSITSGAKLNKDPEAVIQSAEQLLCADPSNPVAHKMLGAAAEALQFYETSAFAYEELLKLDETNPESAKLLMNAYIKIGKSVEAVAIGDAAYRANPSDDEIQTLIKKASVEQTMSQGKWEEEKSFREKLRDEGEAQKLEQVSRVITGEAGIRALIQESKKSVEEQPEDMNAYRSIASNYRQLGEIDHALEWVDKALELEAGRADAGLARMVISLKREKMQKAVELAEKKLEMNPEDATARFELERIKDEEHAFRREQAESLVQRYPNEFSYRFELGELYFEDGETDRAIRELQLALRAPKVRVSALVLLGRAYLAKGFHDLAAEQLQAAKSEMPIMSEQKKDVLYQLGCTYELQGDTERAISEFKVLYGADISYRDVAGKIDNFYSQR